ncbi:MAG: hypothetical protein EPN47_16720 [Acidobacteria bacterium]|nr:MAG: hypothetical protein EPN47_16720 [Acidobacteriota bacterium]
METIEYDQNETEIVPFQQICPRHGERIRRYHGCPKCVIEEVRRHEMRIDPSLEQDIPVPVDSIDKPLAASADLWL